MKQNTAMNNNLQCKTTTAMQKTCIAKQTAMQTQLRRPGGLHFCLATPPPNTSPPPAAKQNCVAKNCNAKKNTI